jgi:hypothetical protein
MNQFRLQFKLMMYCRLLRRLSHAHHSVYELDKDDERNILSDYTLAVNPERFFLSLEARILAAKQRVTGREFQWC